MEEIRWYEKLNYTETKDIIKEKLQNMSRDFVAIGFYLKLIRDKSLFLEDGYKSIWEFAEDNYGIKRSTASRWMAMNDRFSKNGNTPILSEEYISFGKSQLQEMLYLNDKQMEEVKPDMTAREIRGIRTPDPEPEEIEEQIPEQVLGQMCLEDYPEILPEEKHGPAKCITGKSKSGICGAAAYCSENYSCCLECDQNCNSRCGWLDDACDVAQDKQQPSVENVNMDCPPDQGTCPRQNWGTSKDVAQYKRYKEVLGDYIGSLVNFGQMKYNDSEKWKIISEAYIDVKWQSQALKKKQIGEVHSIPYKGTPNSVFDNFKDGALQRRRYYGNDGRPRLDIDMTDHGNSKEHPIVPHYHNWYLDEKGNLKREAKHDNPLKLGHEIANKDILEKR